MFGFDQQMQLATAMMKAFADGTASAMQASTAVWGDAKAADPARSWYRPPAANPFDWSAWMPAGSVAGNPLAAWAMPMTPMAGMASLSAVSPQSWSALASFASMMATMQPMTAYWAPFMPSTQVNNPMAAWQSLMGPMMSQFNAMAAAAVSQPSPFAAYRSTGGHATAQITFADEPKSGWSSTKFH